MEREIDDKFKYKDVTLVVEVGKEDGDIDCTGCYFLSDTGCTIDNIEMHNTVGECANRYDGKLVIFKQVDIKPVYPFYRIANAKRKYSTTPIVRVFLDGNGKEQEEIEICVVLPKKGGDALSEKIVELLNNNVQ
jgi:hypothetical protein